jgi:hypothetical protein
MSGLQRIVRHPDRINDPHVRAHELASEALLGPLAEADGAWLAEHLAGCDPCLEAADAFGADAALLHGLRDEPPPVPRDLGARVSLALDDEVRRATRGRARRLVAPAGGRGPSRRPSLAFAGLAAVAVVALLVGPLAAPLVTPSGTPPVAGSFLPAATPILVDTQPVAWVSRTADGTYVISSARVGEVCPGAEATACGTLDGSARTVGSLAMKPSSVILPRNGSSAVIVGQDAVYAVSVEFGEPVTTPRPEASPVPTSEPVQSPAATGGSTSPPVDSPAPSGSPASPDPSETTEPSPSAPVESPAPTPDAGSPAPGSASPGASGPPASPEPTPEATPEVTPAPATPLPTMPPATPAPTAAAALAIAEGVILVGASPAYSPDGRWVAFSARPADGSHGPDIYAWRVGERRAQALTDDHGSVFSGWVDGRILASAARVAEAPGAEPSNTDPAPDADPASVVARSFLVDPARGSVTALARDGVWRPVVDPTERTVVYWTGSLAWSDTQQAWIPATGRLVAAEWQALLDGAADATARALPREAVGEAVADWEARFDPAGRRLGVWVADPAEPGTGRLALIGVDDDGTLGAVVLADAAALPGFSLDTDRLAWSTPPGRNGQGSLVTVYAWRGDAAGQLRSMPDPGDEPVVVAH